MRRVDVRTRFVAAAFVVLLVALTVLGALLPAYWLYQISAVAIGALIARGLGVAANSAGLVLLCQMSFAAIGGWVVSWVALQAPGIPFVLLLALGGAAAVPVGALLGLATSRIRGIEFAVVTLGFAAALDLILRQGAFPGVGSGTPVIPTAPFDDPRWFFALSWVVLLALQLGLAGLRRTGHGIAWSVVRNNEWAATALGVRVSQTKASAIAVSAMFSGVAGGLLAGQYGLLTADVFSPLTSLVHLAAAVLCGASLFVGAILSGLFAVAIPELLQRFGLPLDVANGLLAFGAFDVLRRGHGGIAEQLRSRLQDHIFRNERVSCDLGRTAVGSDILIVTAQDSRAVDNQLLFETVDLMVERRNTRILEGVNLKIFPGEVHALVGANGAGKSTLIDAITGFCAISEGQVLFSGEPLARFSAYARVRLGIRRTFQRPYAPETISVGEFLRLAAGAKHTKNVDSVAKYFGLPQLHLPVRMLDAGSRRILEIAAALVAKPRLLLLDEPVAGLRDSESLALATLVRRIPEVFGCAVLLVEHDMRFVRASAAVTSVLNEGRLIASGKTSAVLEDPRVVSAYLGRGMTSA